MVKVPGNHFAQMLECILQDVLVGLNSHASESVCAPRRDLGLHKNAVAVAVVQNALVLGPMNAREDAVQIFHIRMVVIDPLGWFRHSELRVAPGHAFYAYQSHTFAIEEERAIPDLKLANAEDRLERVSALTICD